jgi:hypothetical protein
MHAILGRACYQNLFGKRVAKVSLKSACSHFQSANRTAGPAGPSVRAPVRRFCDGDIRSLSDTGASVPDKIQFMSDSGPVIFVCYACGAYNEAP